MTAYDLIIRNGTLIDGSGEPRRAADVAIKGDRIAAIGEPGTLRGSNEIDVAGKVVAPGFIDVHTHDDTALIENPGMAMKASQGVTTVVCGNCGFSAAPYAGPRPVPHNLSLIVKQERFLTQSFAAFAELVESARPAINGAFLIGHATLRYGVLGTDLERPASATETARMRDMLDNALGDGAIGMSSGLFYPPAAHATTDEVAEIAMPLGQHGGVYTAHMRNEDDNILAAMDETFEIGRRATRRSWSRTTSAPAGRISAACARRCRSSTRR